MSVVHRLGLLALGAAGLSTSIQAQFALTEVFANPPGTDQGQEAVEIQGAPNASLAGYFLLAIEGDGTAAGVLDVRTDLGAFSTGANGLLLVRDVAATVILPAPKPETSVGSFDWTPDIENGSNTFVLGFGTPPAAATDLDSDNDGTLDVGALAGFTVVDAVGVLENDGASNFGYGDDLGFLNVGPFDGVANPTVGAHTPDTVYRLLDGDGAPAGWAGGDVLGVNPGGPYSFDFAPNEVFGLPQAGISALDINPGCPNVRVSLLGTPGTLSAAAGGVHALTLQAGASRAGDLYFLVGSVSGTTPGIPVDSVVLPLNFDAYFSATLTPNSPLLAPNLSLLGVSGNGACSLTIPSGTVLGGLPFTAHHAFVVFDFGVGAVTFASNPVPVTLVP